MIQDTDQSDFKKIVKQWLKSHSLDYRWVAEQCGVSEITVRNWMSQKNIPPLKQQLLEKVMVQLPTASPAPAAGTDALGVQVTTTHSLTINLTPELYARLAVKAQAQGVTVETMVMQAITSLAGAADDAPSPTLRNRKIILPS